MGEGLRGNGVRAPCQYRAEAALPAVPAPEMLTAEPSLKNAAVEALTRIRKGAFDLAGLR